MIELEMPQFFTVILIVVACLAGMSALLDEWRDRRMAKAVRRKTVRCRICGAAYPRKGHSAIQDCPECESPNRCGRDRRLG